MAGNDTYGIPGRIGDPAAGLIPLPPAAGPQDGYRSSLTQIDLAPAAAPLMEKMVTQLRAPMPRWSPANTSVTLSDAMRQKTDAIAQRFHGATGKELIVTSGFRTPAAQARAMYDKYALGDTTTYTGPSGREIQAIYDDALARKAGRDAALAGMTAKIAQQLADGRPVSRHLRNEGLDFSIQGMTKAEVRQLEEAVRQHGGVPLFEGRPAHVHASFPPDPR